MGADRVFATTEELSFLMANELKKFDQKERDRLTALVANKDATIFQLRTTLERVQQELATLREFKSTYDTFRKLLVTNGNGAPRESRKDHVAQENKS